MVQLKNIYFYSPLLIKIRYRALQADADKEIEVGTREVRDGTHAFSNEAVGSGNALTEIISKTTFTDYILDKLALSHLYMVL